jgi:transposase-like protein
MLKRWGDNEDKQASARLMAASGMTQRAIAAELGVTDRTLRNWLKASGNNHNPAIQ